MYVIWFLLPKLSLLALATAQPLRSRSVLAAVGVASALATAYRQVIVSKIQNRSVQIFNLKIAFIINSHFNREQHDFIYPNRKNSTVC
jgi:hypothetical protein